MEIDFELREGHVEYVCVACIRRGGTARDVARGGAAHQTREKFEKQQTRLLRLY